MKQLEQLEMTRSECAAQIYRLASNLHYNLEKSIDAAEGNERATALSYEIDARQDLRSLVELLPVMTDLI